MSDTTQMVLWIVIGLVVVALVIWFLASASRRRKQQQAQQRVEAAALRATVEERLPEVQDAEDRASVTGQIAQEARAEAGAKSAEAARLEGQAEEHRAGEASAQSEREKLEREADRIDPDVRTDDDGDRVAQQVEERGAFGRPGGVPGSVAAGVALASSGAAAAAAGRSSGPQAFADEEDEPDLADAENPFAEHTAPTADPDPESDGVNGPVEDPMVVEEVSVPALEDRDDVIVGGGTPSDDPGDHRGQPWSTDLTEPAGPRTASGAAQEPAAPAGHAVQGDEPTPAAAPVAERSQRPYDREERLAVEPAPEPAGSEVPPLDEPEAGEQHGPGADSPARAERRISSFDEVQDGGFGIGSAAPLEDGAQPLGHPVKGFRETSTYIAPGGAGYDEADPDVWFFNEEAARRAGLRPGGR